MRSCRVAVVLSATCRPSCRTRPARPPRQTLDPDETHRADGLRGLRSAALLREEVHLWVLTAQTVFRPCRLAVNLEQQIPRDIHRFRAAPAREVDRSERHRPKKLARKGYAKEPCPRTNSSRAPIAVHIRPKWQLPARPRLKPEIREALPVFGGSGSASPLLNVRGIGAIPARLL